MTSSVTSPPRPSSRPRSSRAHRASQAREARDAAEAELRAASQRGHTSVVRRLVRQGKVDPECGRTDLMRGRAGKDRESPLILAARAGAIDTLELLVASGADVKQRDPKTGRTALHWACKRGHYDLASRLVRAGLDVCGTDAKGRTPLMLAAWWGHTKLVKLLLTYAAHNADVCDIVRGWTPLIGACKYSHLATVELLLRAGASCEARDRLGRTALLHTSHASIAKALLCAGADVAACDPVTGRTVLHWASEAGDADLVLAVLDHLRLLKDPTLVRRMVCALDTLTGCSPVALAKRQGHREALSALRGANFFMYCH